MRKTDLKTKRRYEITARFPLQDDIIKWDVEGYQVAIHGFEDESFFVHRSNDSYSEGMWRISEEKTGFTFPVELEGYSRQEAIDKLTTFLKEKGRVKLFTAMDKAKALLEEGNK